ncbi:HBR275Cp [Eremothecium sinecaudum]|uniref:Biogenesis of lysosome-related organelles complex 1 subunit CNL1 n=1 Tax=Eremothecium sinecaudum TaxID=45286 RepID=A0A125RE19_9SACH|nr:HBR275Cp [Eremothecium sinecaudum]AMD19176.1 HBR275Cp [Eremothecium sinecaudum]
MSEGEEINKDPFHVDQLILDYDYLIYRIKDHVSTIHLETTNACRRQHDLITKGIVEDIIENNIKELRNVLGKCKELEAYILQLNALDSIVNTFHERVNEVIKQLRDIKVHNMNISEQNTSTR